MNRVHATSLQCCDVAIAGAGAAGFAAAIRAAEANARVLLFNSHPRVGLKILMSGGTRCNVTHVEVDAASFNGGSRNAIQLVLRAFPAKATRAWFESLGVSLKTEADGKLFPLTDSAASVLDALVSRARDLGVTVLAGTGVQAVRRAAAGAGVFEIVTPSRVYPARSVILTTGGLSYPKTGSDGSGHAIARSLGHTLVATTPALTPLTLSGDFHRKLQGVTVPAALSLASTGRPAVTVAGSLLFTHFGVSGPAALDLSRHWLRLEGEGAARNVTVHFLPGEARPLAAGGGLVDQRAAERPGGLPRREALEKEWLETAAARPRATVKSLYSGRLPASLVQALAAFAGVGHATPLPRVIREERRRFLEALTAFPLPVTGTLGYRKAEVTAGGVPLDEVDPRRMESRVCPGLFLAGEILDVDGRLGGYNFQWAWSSGHVAGGAAAARALRLRETLA